MRFISKYGRQTLTAIEPLPIPLPTGQLGYAPSPTAPQGERGVVAEFRPLMLRPYEYELALREFKFQGTQYHQDGVTPVSPMGRIGCYDTDEAAAQFGWSPERKKLVEQGLLAYCSNVETKQEPAGASFDAHGNVLETFTVEVGEKFLILSERPRPAPPWPSYDGMRGGGRGNTTADAIATFCKDGGYDPTVALLYEQENRNRDDVVAALLKLVEAQAGSDMAALVNTEAEFEVVT